MATAHIITATDTCDIFWCAHADTRDGTPLLNFNCIIESRAAVILACARTHIPENQLPAALDQLFGHRDPDQPITAYLGSHPDNQLWPPQDQSRCPSMN